MPRLRLPLFLLLVVWIALPAAAQDARPIPYPVTPSDAFLAAVERSSRTMDGRPGPRYWTNTATYRISATLSPDTRMLEGEQTVTYRNRSAYVLDRIYVHLYQNLHQEGAIRNRPQQVTGGIDLHSVSINDREVEETRDGVGYSIGGTLMVVRLAEPLQPGSEVELGFRWRFEVPEAGAPRMGQDGEVFYLGYWYPQIGVFDDVEGWAVDPYLGEGEFYMGFADYELEVTVPDSWLVTATGELVNAGEVLSEQTIRRLSRRGADGEVAHIVTVEDVDAGTATRTGGGTNTWRFRAEQVRDVAFGASDRYLWDSAVATLPDGSTTDVHAFYRSEYEAWQDAAEFGRFSIEYMSERFMPYPWPHMSIVEGIIGGGMEYPMVTLIGSNRSPRSLFGTTLHEIVHMWFPMLVNQNEKRFTWMDEGLTSFLTAEGTAEYWGDDNGFSPERQYYYRLAGTDLEVEPARHADRFPIGSPARSIAHYSKPAVAFNTLRHIIGDEVFWQALREYADRWTYRHPYPWDLFNTVDEVAGADLGWFWRSMFYETWAHDLALAEVEIGGPVVRIVVRDEGMMPMPAIVRVTYDDGLMAEQEIPVDVWLEGERVVDLEFQSGEVMRVEIDPERYLPDVDRTNNVWEGSEPVIGG